MPLRVFTLLGCITFYYSNSGSCGFEFFYISICMGDYCGLLVVLDADGEVCGGCSLNLVLVFFMEILGMRHVSSRVLAEHCRLLSFMLACL